MKTFNRLETQDSIFGFFVFITENGETQAETATLCKHKPVFRELEGKCKIEDFI